MKITLIRHTRVGVPIGTCYGNSDVDVAPTFEEEAKQVWRGLEGQVFDAAYSSPLQRCWKLAMYCGFPNVILDARLKELNFGSWEGQRWEEIRDPRLQDWYNNWLDLKAGGGENFLEQYNRVSDFLDELKTKSYKEVCVFTHGGTMRAALIYAGIYTFNHAFTDDVPYGGKRLITID